MKSERWLVSALVFAALDSGYLAWRYLALRLAVVTPGTSICSWSARIDCDRVLLTPQANAFIVPNALLGAAFYAGCLVWWYFGTRLGPEYRFHIIRTLAFWLGVASVVTLRFFWLLVHLPVFCPLCPLNHFATYIALAAAVILLKRTEPGSGMTRRKPLIALVIACVVFFALCQLLWFAAEVKGILRVPTVRASATPWPCSSRVLLL
jgi:uncharacterized membrane protein